MGTFAGFTNDPGGARPLEGPEESFLVMLFGSITDNYLSGKSFEDQIRSELGLKKNTETVEGIVNGRAVRTIPDAMAKGEMYELKSSIYVYRSSQLLAQLSAARSTSDGYTLVVGRNTRVSAPLQRAIQRHRFGGEIVRAQKDGTYTDLGGRTVEKVESGGWRYKDGDDEGGGDSGGSGGSGVGWLNHSMGQEAARVPVKEYLKNPNIVPMVPLPMPMPMPLPVPAIPAPAPMPIPIFP